MYILDFRHYIPGKLNNDSNLRTPGTEIYRIDDKTASSTYAPVINILKRDQSIVDWHTRDHFQLLHHDLTGPSRLHNEEPKERKQNQACFRCVY